MKVVDPNKHPPADAVAEQPARGLLAGLCLLAGVTSIVGGIALAAGPDGRYAHTPVSALARSPFSTFLVPGLLLLFVVGASNLVAGTLVRRRHRRANEAAFVAGAALWGFIVAEMTMLRTVNAFQVAHLALSIVIVGLAFLQPRIRHTHAPAATARHAQ